MARFVVVDAGPLSLACGPAHNPRAATCRAWLDRLVAQGGRVAIPAIADDEVRRALNHVRATRSTRHLDVLAEALVFIPIDGSALVLAAWLWGEARRRGRPGGYPKTLAADCILTAQAMLTTGPGDRLTIATTNPRHFDLFAPAERWQDIT